VQLARGECLERVGLKIVEHEPKERLEGAHGGKSHASQTRTRYCKRRRGILGSNVDWCSRST
jgi:hypothetical protein